MLFVRHQPLRDISMNVRSIEILDNHLRNAMATKSLATNESLAPNSCKEIADSRNQEKDTRSNQASGGANSAKKLEECHHTVRSGAKVVGGDTANGFIKLGRGWANSEQQGDLEEENQKRRCARNMSATKVRAIEFGERAQITYMERAQNTIMMGLKVKMLAIPTARQMIMDKMPNL